MSATGRPERLSGQMSRSAQREGTPVSRMRAPRAPLALLNGSQVLWLGALLLAVQLPQAYYMPAWVAVLGMLLVVLRMVLQRRPLGARIAKCQAGEAPLCRHHQRLPERAVVKAVS